MQEVREYRTQLPPEERVDAVVADPYAERRIKVERVRQAIFLVFGLIEALIGIRFILRALGANPDAGFASFIYTLTAPFMAPFDGLFGTARFNASVIDWNALIAIIVYGLIAWAIAKLIWIVWGEPRSGLVSHTSRVSPGATEVREVEIRDRE